tara:strand:+ start:7221 stop:10268 length:3048 start_codon:yes stop_codon:yes gene_type:complete
MATTLKDLQKQLDDRSLNPNELSRDQRAIIDELIRRGELKGPSTSELTLQRDKAAKDIARADEFYADPIGQALEAEDSFFKGRPTAELAGDFSASVAPYAVMRKKIFGAAKNGTLWQKGPGKFMQSAIKVADKLPGRFKLLGGALKLVARTADVPAKVIASPLGRAEIYSVLGGSAGAGAGSISYDMLNEQAGITIANAITDAFRDLPEKEIDQDILANSFRATKNAAYWNAGAAALTPFIFGPLGKLTGKLFGAKSEKAVRLSEFAKEKGLPLPLMTGIEDGVLSDLGKNYFKTVGVFPFVSGIGREALQVAEQEAGKQYLDGLVRYAPLMKTSALSSSIYNQAAKTFSDNAAVIGSKYKAFETFAEALGNPRVISLDATTKYAREMVESNRQMFPDIPSYAPGLGDLDIKAIDKYLKDAGDPLNLFMKATAAIGTNKITPKEYSGLMRMLNRAIEGTQYSLPTGSVWSLREALETDLNAFGGKLTKDNLLSDATLKESYDAMVAQSGKAFADADIAFKISQGEQLYGKLLDANATFSSLMGFIKSPLIKSFRKFDSSLFTQRGVNGVKGIESMSRDKIFQTMERDVFASNSPEAIEAFKVIIGATGKNATKNGKALFEASKARYMFNAFLKSFDTAGSPQAKSIFNDVAMEAGVKSGNKYMSDAMEELGTDAIARSRGFSIDDVRLNNGIYDVSKIRFGPKDFAEFNINKFMDNLGIGKATEDLGRDKMLKLLGSKGSEDFYKFTDYMKAISDVAISDTSTFLQRRFTLSGGRGVLTGVVVGGGMAAVNPLAPLVFLALARKAGSVLSDPVALRLMNDALGVDDQLKILSGKKIRGKKYGTGAYRQVTPKLTAAGLTQKREAFARFMNYIFDEDEDTPRIDPKTIDPIRIQEMLLGMPFENPKPRYDEKNLPKETVESMFAQDFTPSSGNVETDNQLVDYIQSTVRASDETDIDQESRNVEAERASVMGDVQLESPVQATPNTGQQVNPQQFQALFPNDPTGAAIAMRGRRNV